MDKTNKPMCSNRFENERQSKPVTTTVCFIILYSAEGEVKEKNQQNIVCVVHSKCIPLT